MVLSPFIRVIVLGLLWYLMPFSRSWLNEIRFESYLGAKATLWSLIVVLSASGMETVPISSIRMTWPAAVMKLILLAQVLLKRCWLLYRCRDAHEFKNQEELDREVFCRPRCLLIIKAVPMGPGAKRSGSESFLLSEACWARFGVALESLCFPLWYPLHESPLYDSFLQDFWVLLFSLLSDNEQSLPKWPSLWQL